MKKTIALMLAVISLVLLVSCRAATPKDSENTGNESTVPPVVAGTGNAVDTTENEETKAEAPVETTAPETTVAEAPQMDEGKAVSIARQYLGETDPDTGYTYSYQFETITSEGNYKIKVSWYIEEDERFSTCGYLIVTPDGEVSKFDW